MATSGPGLVDFECPKCGLVIKLMPTSKAGHPCPSVIAKDDWVAFRKKSKKKA